MRTNDGAYLRAMHETAQPKEGNERVLYLCLVFGLVTISGAFDERERESGWSAHTKRHDLLSSDASVPRVLQ